MNPHEAYKQFVIEELDRSLGYYKQACEELRQEVRRLRQENKRYREALTRIDKQASDIVSRNFDYVAVGNLFELGLIAREALEGGESEA